MGKPNPNVPDDDNKGETDSKSEDENIPADETELVNGDNDFSDEKNALIIYIQMIIDDFTSYFMV